MQTTMKRIERSTDGGFSWHEVDVAPGAPLRAYFDNGVSLNAHSEYDDGMNLYREVKHE